LQITVDKLVLQIMEESPLAIKRSGARSLGEQPPQPRPRPPYATGSCADGPSEKGKRGVPHREGAVG
jgi:hypothetical protein